MYNIFVWKIEKPLNTIFQRMLVFRFLLVSFPFARLNLPKNSFTHLRHSVTFLFVCFHSTITWLLGKVNKNIKSGRESQQLNWRSVLVFGVHKFQRPPLKRQINYCCRICRICSILFIFKTRLLMEALCRPLFTKYGHCKPLFSFQNNA